MRKLLIISLFLLNLFRAGAQSIIYVNAQAKGTNDGTTWTNAFKNLQDAINKASQAGATVWVAGGTYKPDRDTLNAIPANTRNASFVLKSSVAVYGGFKGTESRFNLRDPAKYQTILSGEIGDTTITNDNSYHIVYAPQNTQANAILDGFMIINGLASATNGGGAFLLGGTIENCTFINNVATNGGAVYTRNASVVNCEFKYNTATQNGGAIYAISSTIDTCTFNNNTAIKGGAIYATGGIQKYCTIYSNKATNQGGGIYSSGSSIIGVRILNNTAKQGGGLYTQNNTSLINTLITNNYASENGGGIYTDNGGIFTNITICRNESASTSGGMFCSGTNTLRNSVLWNNIPKNISTDNSNSSFLNVALSDSSKLTGNNTKVFKLTNLLSVFIQPVDSIGNVITATGISSVLKSNWQPQQYSKLVDAGDNTCITQYNEDINKKVRIINGNVDIGAYEAPGAISYSSTHIIYVKQSWTGTGDGSSWENATSNLTGLFTYLTNTNTPTNLQVWVQQGTYYPSLVPNTGFKLYRKVAIYGGFVGNETVLEQRDWINNPTTLSGDIGVKLDVSDNIETVISMAYVTLDGFIIYNGKYHGISASYSTIRNCEIMYCGTLKKMVTDPYVYGAGIYATNTIIEKCKIHNNKTKYGCAGGIYISLGSIDGCTIYNNEANLTNAGGVYLDNSQMKNTLIHDCSIIATIAPYVSGGGVFSYNSTIENCEIYRNTSEYYAGGLQLRGTSIIKNSKIYQNTASQNGGGLYCDQSAYIFNSLIENNKSLSYGGGSFNGSFINCIIANNEAGIAGGICEPNIVEYSTIVNNRVSNDYSGLTLSSGTVRYSVIWGNKGGTTQFIKISGYGTFEYSAIEGGYSGNSTLALFASNDDNYGPNFVSASTVAGNTTTSGDWHLMSTSPLIDRALIDKETPSKDYYNNCRLIGLAPDFGAAEFGTSEYATVKTKRLFVKQGSTGTGLSWSDALGDLNRALFIADYINATEVWVAAGTYYPSTTRERWISFNLRDSVYLYGGFAGTELFLEERNITANKTILSGDIGRRMRSYDNSFNIVYFNPITATDTTSIDGFSIADAYYEGDSNAFPHAMYIRNANISNCNFETNTTNALDAQNCKILNCSFSGNNANSIANSTATINNCSVQNCTFSNNKGINGAGANATNSSFSHCTATGNTATSNGGAFYGTNTTFESCSIFNNSAGNSGGGLYSKGSLTKIYNSLIYNNSAVSAGGGLFLDSVGSVYATTITRNLSKNNGGGIYMRNASISSFYNSILWGNRSETLQSSFILQNPTLSNIHNCGIDDTLFSTIFASKINLDTANYGIDSTKRSLRFIFPTSFAGIAVTDTQKTIIRYADWNLGAYSGAIDQGVALPLLKVDIAGNTRTIDGDKDNKALPDLGAYESKSNKIIASKDNIVFVSPKWKGTGDGSSWQNARDELQEVIDTLSNNKGGIIWVSKGTYTPIIDYREFNDSTDLRGKSFILKRKVSIYGGFNESDTSFVQRDISGNKTILSGVAPNGENRGNLYHVVYAGAECDTAEINGFYITGGIADHFSIAEYKDGGGAYMLNGDIVKCYIIGNTAFQYGGGTAMRNKSRMINCVVANNYSYRRAGGVYGTDSSIISLSTIVNNGSGLINGGAEITGASNVVNSVLWNNSAKKDSQLNPLAAISFSAIQSTQPLTQPNCIQLAKKNTSTVNDSLYPAFVAPASIIGLPAATILNQTLSADWSLTKNSSLINIGQLKKDIITTSDSTDLFENQRVYEDTVDVGAFEYGAYPIITTNISDVTLCELNSSTLSIKATGKNLKYQWQYFGVSKWITIPENEYFDGMQTNSLKIIQALPEMDGMEIRCVIWNSNGTVTSNEIVCTVYSLPTVFDQKSIKLCGKELLSVTDSSSYSYQWNTGSKTSSIAPIQTDWYKLTVTNKYGCKNSDSIWVNIYKQPEEPFKETLIKTCTGKPVILQPPVYQHYLWQDGSDADIYIAYNSGIYILKATDDNGCTIIDSITISVISHPATELNLVTYNNEGTAMLIDWNTKDPAAIIGHEVYRTNDNSGNFSLIGSIDISKPDDFKDTTATFQKQYSYSVTSRDTCGVESDFSIAHTPVFVAANYRVSNRNIVDLNWTPYKGLTYNSYILQRGKTVDNLAPFATVSSSEQYYTLNVDGYEYYRVAIPIINPFTIEGIVYDYAYSNISKISDLRLDNTDSQTIENLIVYPNPSNEKINISTTFASMPEFVTLKITNTLGMVIKSKRIEPTLKLDYFLDIGDIPSGIYYITIQTNTISTSKVFVVE